MAFRLNADSRRIMMLFWTLVILFGVSVTKAYAKEIKAGEKVPNIRSEAYDGSGWKSFELYDYFDPDWNGG